jgi:hypothetical protein
MAIKLYMPDRSSQAREKLREFFRQIKYAVLPEAGPGLPAFACAGAYNLPLAGRRATNPDPLDQNWSYFDVGRLPKRGTPARELMEGKSIEVLLPGEKRNRAKPQLNYALAQKEVSNMKKDPRAVHQHIAYEAARLYDNDPLVSKHTLALVAGAAAEDFFFAPGESMKDICLGDPAKVPGVVWKLADDSGGKSLKSTVARRIFMLAVGLWKFITGDVTLDPLDRPYFAHFDDPRRRLDDQGLNLFKGELRFQSARSRMLMYWNLAVKSYAEGDVSLAFVNLGHLVHLVGDLHVPAHVHNTPHASNLLICKPDSLEDWTGRRDYPIITRSKGKSNATIWSARNLPITPVADRSWNRDNLAEKLGTFALNLSLATQKFRSVDAKGKGLVPFQNKTGALDDGECFYQAETLIPAAIADSAQIIVNFVDYIRRNGEPVSPVNPAVICTTVTSCPRRPALCPDPRGPAPPTPSLSIEAAGLRKSAVPS